MTALEKFEKDITEKLNSMTPEELKKEFEAAGVVFYDNEESRQKAMLSNLNLKYQYSCYSQYKGRKCSGNVIHWFHILYSLIMSQDITIHEDKVTYYDKFVTNFKWVEVSEIGYVPVFENTLEKYQCIVDDQQIWLKQYL
jgi:hypothetical protein